jgi:UDP-N-acetylmuramoyl-tripeptide--D-alanyl-D-alanine ligase
VGEQGPEFHAEIGGYAREQGVHFLLTLGDLTLSAVSAYNAHGGSGGEHFLDIEPLTQKARQLAGPGVTLLVKGSRFMRMERLVQAIC